MNRSPFVASLLAAFPAAVLAPVFAAAAPAAAEVVESDERGFVTRDEVVVEADPKAVWLALISPAKWWKSEHTWSGDAANLTLTPQAGGCFCEKIPEVDEPDRFTLEGSVEHMRVIQAYPESALRMVGALGPLQSEPVTGVLTIALSKVETADGTGTRIVWEYNVGGSMRYEVPVISKAVDGVMSLQLAGLGELLGVAPLVKDAGKGADDETDDEASAKADDKADDKAVGERGAGSQAPIPAVIEAENTLEQPDEAGSEAAQPAPKPSAVDEAFGDLMTKEPG